MSTLLEVAGMACVCLAGFLIFIPLGLFLAGCALVLTGYLLGGNDESPPAS